MKPSTEYRAAAQAATRDLDALRAAMYARPGFADRAAAAATSRPDDVPVEELVPDWPTRLQD